MMELVDIADLKSVGFVPCEFKSRWSYFFLNSSRQLFSYKEMAVYRIAINTNGYLYYLIPDVGSPALDTPITGDSEFEFDNAVEKNQTFKYSTRELAEASMANLPFPYDERCEVIASESEEDPIPKHIYFRAGKYLPRIFWLNLDGSYTRTVDIDTIVQYNTLSEMQEHVAGLPGWDDKITRIIKVLDYGAPNYAFDTISLKSNKVIEFGDKSLSGVSTSAAGVSTSA